MGKRYKGWSCVDTHAMRQVYTCLHCCGQFRGGLAPAARVIYNDIDEEYESVVYVASTSDRKHINYIGTRGTLNELLE